MLLEGVELHDTQAPLLAPNLAAASGHCSGPVTLQTTSLMSRRRGGSRASRRVDERRMPNPGVHRSQGKFRGVGDDLVAGAGEGRRRRCDRAA